MGEPDSLPPSAADSLGGAFRSLGGADGSPAPVGGSYLSKPVIAARENLTKPNIKARK